MLTYHDFEELTAEIAMRCAALHVRDPAPERDAMIAATALTHGMTLVTRNVSDFARSGVALLNPWKFRPASQRLTPHADP